MCCPFVGDDGGRPSALCAEAWLRYWARLLRDRVCMITAAISSTDIDAELIDGIRWAR
jgi:hypothetical protein